jgi:hypothetical protein
MLTNDQIEESLRQREEAMIRELAITDNEENIRILRRELYAAVKMIYGEEIQRALAEQRKTIIREEALKEKLKKQNEVDNFHQIYEEHKRREYFKKIFEDYNKKKKTNKDTETLTSDWRKVWSDMKKVWSGDKSSKWGWK